MSDFQVYEFTLRFFLEHPEILGRFALVFALSAILGVMILDRFKIGLWVAFIGLFILLNQWQIDVIMTELGFTNAQIMQPHVITIFSALMFVSGAATGYFIKKKFYLAYTKQKPQVVASEIVSEINGTFVDNSESLEY